MIFQKQSKYVWTADGRWRMFVRWLYHKVLDEPYIPTGTTAYLVRKPQVHKKEWGTPDSVRLQYKLDKDLKRLGVLEDYIFDVSEDSNGIKYLKDL